MAVIMARLRPRKTCGAGVLIVHHRGTEERSSS
jgi:hypothetical protein